MLAEKIDWIIWGVHVLLWVCIIAIPFHIEGLFLIICAEVVVYGAGVVIWWNIFPMRTHASTFMVPVMLWPIMLPMGIYRVFE